MLEGDIRGCFDKISHQWLIDNTPTDRQILTKWLIAGYRENGKLFPVNSGTPPGGIISPVLANIALDGDVHIYVGRITAYQSEPAPFTQFIQQ